MALLEVDNLSVSFGGIRAVAGISFEVNEGEVVSIIGPNGAGKTSILNLISRFFDAATGQINFNGTNITNITPDKVVGHGIARTFQNLNLFDRSTVLENLMLGRYRHRKTNLLQQIFFSGKVYRQYLDDRILVEKVIEFLEIEKYRDSVVMNLPYGIAKVVELARALVSQPKLLLLDEPSSGLNNEETDDLTFWIEDIRAELGISVLMVEHDMKLVSAVSDRVIAVNAGTIIAEGKPEEIQQNKQVVTAYLGTDA